MVEGPAPANVVCYCRIGLGDWLGDFDYHKSHPAEILDLGHKAIYYIPLLGTSWRGVYEVSKDEGHLHSTLSCGWAVGHEVIHKLSGPTTRSA